MNYQKRESIDDIVNAERDSRPQILQAMQNHRDNIERALAQAKEHLNSIAHNPVAVERQRKVIADYEAQLTEIALK